MLQVKINGDYFAYTSSFIKTLLQKAASLKKAIPVLCYHKNLPISGNCRICSVELKGIKKPITSCYFPALTQNQEIIIKSPKVKKATENVVEMLLVNHPLDCPTCDQGGECDLQDKALAYGRSSSRFFFKKRSVSGKVVSTLIRTSMVKCINCTRCVRLSFFLGSNSMGSLFRSRQSQISGETQKFMLKHLSSITDICPVGKNNKI